MPGVGLLLIMIQIEERPRIMIQIEEGPRIIVLVVVRPILRGCGSFWEFLGFSEVHIVVGLAVARLMHQIQDRELMRERLQRKLCKMYLLPSNKRRRPSRVIVVATRELSFGVLKPRKLIARLVRWTST